MEAGSELLNFVAGRLEYAGSSGYGTLLLDPPWPSDSRGGKRDHWLSAHTKPRYSTMSEAELVDLPVGGIAALDAVLVMWTTWMHLEMAFRLLKVWNFKYATGFPWLKVVQRRFHPPIAVHDQVIPAPIYGPGVWVQHCTEIVLIARRGSPFGKLGNPRPARKGIIVAPRQEHSRKPDELHQWIETANPPFPSPRIELFARRSRPGWTCWGNEL